MSYLSDVPYRCPKCGDARKFSSLRELKSHLDEEHSFRGPGSSWSQERRRSNVFSPLTNQKYLSRRSSGHHSGRLSPLSMSYNEDAKALEERLKYAKELENSRRINHRVAPGGLNHASDTISMLSRDVIQARRNQWNTADALYQSQDVLEGLQASAEDQRRQQLMGSARLKNDLEQKERSLSKANKDLEAVTRERLKLEAEKTALAQKMEESSGKVTNLQTHMREKDEQLQQKQREYDELMKFLEGAAQKEAVARERLEEFINGILSRAEKAESELQAVRSRINTPTPPVPKDVLNYLAHTQNDTGPKTPDKLRNGYGPRMSPGPTPQHRGNVANSADASSADPRYVTTNGQPGPNGHRGPSPVVSNPVYGAGYRPQGASPGPQLSPQPPVTRPYHPKAKHKASPSQSLRSKDSGVPEDIFYREKSKLVTQLPNKRSGKKDYYRYEDESDYDGYIRADEFENNDEDYSISRSDVPNLDMLGNTSDSPNEFYHSSDEGIPDFYLDSDGILWDESVFAQGARIPERSTLHRASPSGSESGGQIIQTSNPADVFANTIKARTSFSSSQKPSILNNSKSHGATNSTTVTPKKQSEPILPSNSKSKSTAASVSNGVASKSPKEALPATMVIPESSAEISKPYNREEYIRSIKNSAKSVNPNNVKKEPMDGEKEKIVGIRQRRQDLTRENSSSSSEVTPVNSSVSKVSVSSNSKPSSKDSSVVVAIADVHVEPSKTVVDSTQNRPVPAKRTAKAASKSPKEDLRSDSRSKIAPASNGSLPKNNENSKNSLGVEDTSSSTQSSSIPPPKGRESHVINETLAGESAAFSSDTIRRKSIQKQPSIGRITPSVSDLKDGKPPKPPRQISPMPVEKPENDSVNSGDQITSERKRPLNLQHSSQSSFADSQESDVDTISERRNKRKDRGSAKRKMSRQLTMSTPGDSIQNVSPIQVQMADLEMMTESDADVSLHDAGVGPSGPGGAERIAEIKRRRLMLFCIFLYVDTKTLSQVSAVCKEWRVVSRHPALWRRVRLHRARISAQYLLTISQWCSQLQSLSLEGLKPRRKRKEESDEEYTKNTRGSLERGFEELLRVSQNTLLSLKISNCENILTERCLWEVSCYSRLLQRLCYISATDPLGPEVMWNMGAGCRDITTLIVSPAISTDKPSRFNNKCVQLIGQFYPELKTLSIGGSEVDERGLLSLATQCRRLQVLELDHMREISEDTAQALCDSGLKELQVIEFTNTPVTPKAVHIISKNCRRLQRINIRVSISDYFEDTLLQKNVDKFKNIVEKFHSLKKRSNLSSVLRIKTDAEGKERLRST